MSRHIALYARTSTQNQATGLESQIRALEAYCSANQIADFVIYKDEGVSGSKSSRPELDKMMEAVNKGRVSAVVVFSFSRFARSTRHLLTALDTFNSKGIGFVSLSEKIDTSTTTGKFVFSILASVAELERTLIQERVRNGLVNARAKGKILGRPKQTINVDLIKHLHQQKMPHRQIAKMVGVSQSTVSREIRAIESKSVREGVLT